MCAEGGRIVGWRHETLAALAGPLADAHAEIAPGEGALGLRYVTNAPSRRRRDRPRPRCAAASRRPPRRSSGTAPRWWGRTATTSAFELGGRDLAGFASRGQQRTAILALKLAQLDLLTALDGRPPLLLLDDVFSELDPDRRAHLVRRIGGLPQAFVTTTTLDDLDPALVAASTAWRVEPGRLERVGDRDDRAPPADAPPVATCCPASRRSWASRELRLAPAMTQLGAARGGARAGRGGRLRRCSRCARPSSW